MMSDRTSLKWQWIASASGIGFVFFYTIFFGYFGHNLPPVSAALSANDLGYLMFNITYMGTTLQAVAVGIVGLADKSEHPLFPRWVSWVAILAGISFIPITLDPFFKSGPWSWNGSMNFWAWFATYFVWIVTMSWCMSADVWRKLKAA